MSAKDYLIDAADGLEAEYGESWIRHLPSAQFMLSLATWFRAESESHFHIWDEINFIYEMPGMEDSPACIAAKQYLVSREKL